MLSTSKNSFRSTRRVFPAVRSSRAVFLRPLTRTFSRRSPRSRSSSSALRPQARRVPSRRRSSRLETPTNRREKFPASILFIFHFFSFFASRETRKRALFRSKDENFKKTFFYRFKIGKLRKIYRFRRRVDDGSSVVGEPFARRPTPFLPFRRTPARRERRRIRPPDERTRGENDERFALPTNARAARTTTLSPSRQTPARRERRRFYPSGARSCANKKTPRSDKRNAASRGARSPRLVFVNRRAAV